MSRRRLPPAIALHCSKRAGFISRERQPSSPPRVIALFAASATIGSPFGPARILEKQNWLQMNQVLFRIHTLVIRWSCFLRIERGRPSDRRDQRIPRARWEQHRSDEAASL